MKRAESTFALVVHGGAGKLNEVISKERTRQAREGLKQALLAGHALLDAGGSSIDAVETTVKVLEDCPVFNAGKGAVFTHEGTIELDASIMDGRTNQAGAVAGVTIARNPISAARAVMEKSPHVFLMGPGADQFVREVGLPTVKSSYFWTPESWEMLQKMLTNQARAGLGNGKANAGKTDAAEAEKLGTVGAVALDRAGNIAAATSTGGTPNKQYGRVGDSPIIGAGTFAENGVCGVSATGHGEYFIRFVVAYDIAALIKYKGMSLAEAAADVVQRKLAGAGGEGGVIALDSAGNVSMEFNTEGMYRGFIKADGNPFVAIFKE